MMFDKILFFCFLVLIPAQIYKACKKKNLDQKLMDLGIGAVMGMVIAIDWPLYCRIERAFGGMGILFGLALIYFAYREKIRFCYFTGTILILSSVLLVSVGF